MKKITLLFLLFSWLGFSQGEANNWYFGRNAGIKFLSDGTVVQLPGSKMSTNEGCSSISDAQGKLLFYTDGRNVWDAAHKIMPNANYDANTGLLGDPSSTQSAIIVPKKGDPDIYYVFTVDEPHNGNAAVYPAAFSGSYQDTAGGSTPADDDGLNNGLNYSVVDLSVTANGTAGDVTTRNVHLVTYDPANIEDLKYKCSEKITAVKTANGSGFWVITHFKDKFYAFKVDGTGVNETPVVTQIAPVVPTGGYRRNSIGYLKASPDGTKLAVAHNQTGTTTGVAEPNGYVYLYDFDAATGMVSNAVLVSDTSSPYGIEFSREAKKLYVSYDDSNDLSARGVKQFDLLAASIAGSGIMLANTVRGSGALQLGPNGKIYRAINGATALDVINSPEEDSLLSDYQQGGQPIGGPSSRIVTLGLPPFITSLFSVNIIVGNNCVGQATRFELNVTGSFDSVSWNFGDGSGPANSTADTITHSFAAGTYTVTADVFKGAQMTQVSTEVTVSPVPVANTAPTITECDNNNDGTATFNLAANTAQILGSQSNALYEVKYFKTQANADDNVQALTADSYTNTTPSETIYARIHSKANTTCYATTSFQVQVSATPVVNSATYAICDDAVDGDDTNGFAAFNFAAVTQALLQNPAQFTVTYYSTDAAAQAQTGALPQNYNNTTAGQQVVHARIVNTASPSCFAVVPVTLNVNPLPPAVTGAQLVQCDIDVAPDDLAQFNLREADAQFTGGSTGITVSYYTSVTAAQNNAAALAGTYTNTANPQVITAKVTNIQTGCFRLLPLTLQVNVTTTAPVTLPLCEDDGTEDGFTAFNLNTAGLGITGNNVAYYASAADALLEQNPITAVYTNTIAYNQSVYGRIENNNTCTAIQEIKLIVNPLPDIDIDDEAIVCLNTRDNITLDAGVGGTVYRYEWSTGAATRTIEVNQPGIYTVKVIIKATGCEKTRTITVTASDVAAINSININDFRDENTVTVNASAGNVNTSYLYSLDMPTGPFQESNFFNDVAAGIHTVYVYDTNKCGIVSKQIAVLGAPKFFTPNGDGVNDTWDIIGVNALFYKNSSIHIFDRFGKLLAKVDPAGRGWDGNYNGLPLPASDYWYVIQLDDGRIVKGHMSIIR
jgi:gliding motility-associated-like protein